MKKLILIVIIALFIFFALSYKSPDSLHFCIVADRTGAARPGIFENALEQINQLNPEFTTCVGDLIEGFGNEQETKKQWAEFNLIVSRLKNPFYKVPGNHDIFNKWAEDYWYDNIGPTYGHYVKKNVLFLYLDTEDFDRSQVQYFIEMMGRYTPKWTFVLMHRPLWKDNNSEFERLQQHFDKRFTIFAGHEHVFSLEKHGPAWYYILATTGGASDLRGEKYGEFDHFMDIVVEDVPTIENVMVK